MKVRLAWGSSLQAQQEADKAFRDAKRKKKQPPKPKKTKVKPERPEYFEYINSCAWHIKRRQAFKHHGLKCQICGSDKDLEVHHKNYARLGREKMKDLEILCRPCHANHHEGQKPWIMDPMTEQFSDLVKKF